MTWDTKECCPSIVRSKSAKRFLDCKAPSTSSTNFKCVLLHSRCSYLEEGIYYTEEDIVQRPSAKEEYLFEHQFLQYNYSFCYTMSCQMWRIILAVHQVLCHSSHWTHTGEKPFNVWKCNSLLVLATFLLMKFALAGITCHLHNNVQGWMDS